jgi:hypothetical protein
MDGPIKVDDVFKDLRSVMGELDPSEDPLHIGTSIREKARQRVQQGIDSGVLSSWDDVHELIQEQDDEDLPLEEGQEAFDVLVGGDDDDDDGDDDPDSDDDKGGLPAKHEGGSGLLDHSKATSQDDGHIPDPNGDDHLFGDESQAPPSPLSDLLDDICDLARIEAEGDALVAPDVLATDGSQPNASSFSCCSLAPPGKSQAACPIQLARELLHREALKNRDDSFARILRTQMAGERRKRKAADVPEAVVLRDCLEEGKKLAIRRQADAREDERSARMDLETKKRVTAEAEAAAHTSKRLAIEAVMLNRKLCEADSLKNRRRQIYARWLNGDFAAEVARRLLGMSTPARSQMSNII